ncbi:MAG: S41 family peptidase [Bacteroidales bacterium]
MSNFNNSKISSLLPLIIAASILFGIFVADFFSANNKNSSLLVPKKIDKLSLLLDFIASEYVDSISNNELIELAIPKILESLDPHSIYITAEDAKSMQEELSGDFEGIGIQFNMFKDTLLVVNVIKNGPSEKAGLKAGDKIIFVDSTKIAGVGIKNQEVIKMLKGPAKTNVDLKILRKNSKRLLNFSIIRDKIPLYSVDAAYKLAPKTAYLKIAYFAANTHSQFVDAMFTLQKTGLDTIVLDLRDNSGGYLTAATDILDEFFPKDIDLVYTEGRARQKQFVKSTSKRNYCQNMEIIVLINEFSASASEIVAGAIQDNDRGFIIGRRSYGKGLVQEATTFNDGSVIRLTTARYFTPSGRCIQKPYEHGADEYNLEVYNRFLNGEFLDKDSIKLNDSLIFYTKNKRPVFGSGGIMPDIFVPIDTSGYTDAYGKISRNNLDYIFSIEYVKENRSRLEKIKSTNELLRFLKKDAVLQKFYNYLSENNITVSQRDIRISGKYIENNLYAYIARQILGDSSFYEISNTIDPVIDTVMNVIRNNRKLIEK